MSQPQTKNRKPLSFVSVYRNLAQAGFNQGVYGRVNFDIEEADTLAEWDNVTNYQFTPHYSGRYLVTAKIVWATTPNQYSDIAIRVNGVARAIHDYEFAGIASPSSSITEILTLNAGDTVQIWAIYGIAPPANSISGITTLSRLQITRLS